jgi:hypothetical protein
MVRHGIHPCLLLRLLQKKCQHLLKRCLQKRCRRGAQMQMPKVPVPPQFKLDLQQHLAVPQ